MIIKRLNRTLRICDSCKKKSILKGEIKRCAFYMNIPYYDYIGFDLCCKCLKKLEKHLKNFLKFHRDIRGLK